MAVPHYSMKLAPLFKLDTSDPPPVITLSTDSKDGAEAEVSLGRSNVTGITDKRCSRQHARLQLDSKAGEVVIRQDGANSCCVVYKKDKFVLLKHQTKRLSLDAISSDSGKCSLYLVAKDMMYGYNMTAVVAKGRSADSAAVPSTSNGNIPRKSTEAKKRSLGTLDGFITKKAKVDSNSTGEKTSMEKKVRKGSWSEPEPLVYLFSSSGSVPSSKIAGFDMDSTLITTASGAKWPKDKNDWKFYLPVVPDKLRSLHREGYKLVIFTNQGGIMRGTVKAADIQHKIEAIIDKVGVPIEAMIAGGRKGTFRKPLPGMWIHIATKDNGGVVTDTQSNVYVGDAAGRVANWQPGKKKDFACSDRLFALNAGVRFATPETFFNGAKEGEYVMPEFNPSECLKTLLEPPTAMTESDSQDLIVMVGFPGSGKSFFSSKYLKAYRRVNRDTLGSWQKCVARCNEELQNGKSVVIDNTNPDQETRARYIDVAKKHKVPVRCFHMSTSYKHSRHNEVYRQLTDRTHKPINDMVVNAYKSKFSEPSLSEGFTELVKVNVVPQFDNDEDRKLYASYLLEK